MVKYRFGRRVRPYLAGGGVVWYVRPVRGHGTETIGSLVTQTSSITPMDTTDPSELPEAFLSRLDGRRCRAWHRSDSRVTRTPLRSTATISGRGGLLRFTPNQLEFSPDRHRALIRVSRE